MIDTIVNLEGEEWRDIEGYIGYQVSNMGRVKSLKHRQAIILHTFTNNKGYERVALSHQGRDRRLLVSRLVAEAFCERPDARCNTTDHIDGNKLNNRADNLRWLTIQDNIKVYYERKKKEGGEGNVSN